MDWRLRRAIAADAPALSLIAAATFLESFAGILPGADIVAHVAAKSSPAVFAAWVGDAASVVTLAEHPDGAAPMAYSVLTTPDEVGETGSYDIELRRIYASATTRGTGLGAMLMARAIADAAAMGRRRMLLGVLARNRRACAFYERQGFTIVGERRFQVGATRHDDLVYARRV